jgi:hypothetical protein
MKKILEHKFYKPGGGGIFFQQTRNGLRTKKRSFNRILSELMENLFGF